jgi:hypothetical protein
MQAEDWDSSASSSGSCSDSNDEGIWNHEELTVCQHCGLLLAEKGPPEKKPQAIQDIERRASVAAWKRNKREQARANEQWKQHAHKFAANQQRQKDAKLAEQHRNAMAEAAKKAPSFWGSLGNKAKKVVKKR